MNNHPLRNKVFMPGTQKKKNKSFFSQSRSEQFDIRISQDSYQQTHLPVSNPLQDPVQTDARHISFNFL